MSTRMSLQDFQSLTPKRALELVVGEQAAQAAIGLEKRRQMRQEPQPVNANEKVEVVA